MPLDLVSNFVLSLAGLLQGSLLTAIPAYLLTLAGLFFKRRLDARYKLSWFKGVFLITFLMVLVIVFILYYTPIVSSLGQATIGVVPEEFSPTLEYTILSALGPPLRLVLVALVLTFLLLPLEFIGSFIFDAVKERRPKLNMYLNLALSVFLTTVVAALLAFWVLPGVFGIDVITGVIYLIFFGT